MLSIGFLCAIRLTGKKLETNATKKLTPNNNTICLMPKVSKVIVKPSSFNMARFIKKQHTLVAMQDSTKLIMQITKLSQKKIENTSLPLAPIARNMPISRFL